MASIAGVWFRSLVITRYELILRSRIYNIWHNMDEAFARRVPTDNCAGRVLEKVTAGRWANRTAPTN